MNAFSVNFGSCTNCTRPAQLGSTTCIKCGETFERLCETCSKKPCTKCGGKLADTVDVFPNTLFDAIAKGNEEKVREILTDRTTQLDEVTNRHGETPLSVAARQKPASIAKTICETLIEFGASPNAKSAYGRTALMNMIWHRSFSTSVAKLLLDSIDEKDVDGRTALMFAVRGAGLSGSEAGNLSITKSLLSLGANQALCDNSGKTARNQTKNLEIMALLKTSGR